MIDSCTYRTNLWCFTLVGFEWDLQDSVAQCVSIEWLDSNNSFIIICHCNKSEAFALVGLKVANDFHTLNSTKWTKKLPQNILFRFWSQVIHEYTPTGAIHRVARKHWVGQKIPSKRWVPITMKIIVQSIFGKQFR